jgi:peptidoglycan/xylan/chitin deacetylase (PgdA/CDA1 family)
MSFSLARLMGPGYGLRCVLFHDISNQASPFTDGLEVTLRPQDFEARIRFLAEHYTPVGLDAVLSADAKLPPRPVLLTFDDAYASVAHIAAPICRKYGIPAVFFVNASLVGNQDLALDNLVCYAANVHGMEPINLAARKAAPGKAWELASMGEVFSELLPLLALSARYEFREALAEACRINTAELARDARLYVTLDELRSLSASGFEIANHTYSHVHCRVLQGDDFRLEIEKNKQQLEDMLGRPVRAFSVPYGFSADLTPRLSAHLSKTGHEAVFLVESRANTSRTALHRLNRVSVRTSSDADFFGELEVLPRIRSIKDRLTGAAVPA